jgi:hypothetical protein
MNVIQELQAGVRVQFNEAGRFLRILASDLQDKMTVEFYRNGASISKAEQVGRGFSETMEDGPFDAFAVTSSITQNVNIVTRAGSRILYDTPPVGDVNVLSLPPVVIANPDAQKRYFQYGASYKSSAAMAANVPETIFTAAANVNGAILHRAGFSSYRSSGTGISIVAKASAPASITDGDVILQQTSATQTASSVWPIGVLDQPVLIPAGKGLYAISDNAESIALRSALYTLL